jgi:hypothetical protein
MPFDSAESSPCKGCHLQDAPKASWVGKKHGNCTQNLRSECDTCKDLKAYQDAHKDSIVVTGGNAKTPFNMPDIPPSQWKSTPSLYI